MLSRKYVRRPDALETGRSQGKGESYRVVRQGFATTLRLVCSRIARTYFRDSTLTA